MLIISLVKIFTPVLIGILLGLLGGGGSVLAVPALVYLYAEPAKQAIATSLFAIGISSLISAIYHGRKGNLVLQTALVFSLTGSIGAYLGASYIAPLLSDSFQLLLFIILLLVMSFLMLFKKEQELSGNDSLRSLKSQDLVFLSFCGLGIGLITGLIGVGGGFLIVPALYYLAKISMKKAIGTSLLVIALQSFSAFIGYLKTFSLDATFILEFTALILAGSLLGAFLSSKFETAILKKMFAFLLLCIGIFMLIFRKF